MTKHLQDLLDESKEVCLYFRRQGTAAAEFAYGNTVIENPRITREMIDRAAEDVGRPEIWNLGLY